MEADAPTALRAGQLPLAILSSSGQLVTHGIPDALGAEENVGSKALELSELLEAWIVVLELVFV